MVENKKIKIVTHSSAFHTDDIFAVATLLIMLGDAEVEVIRSREMDVIDGADYVVDTGNIYDPNTNRFDHHQEGGAGKRENGIPYASFGLVWKHFGEKVSGSKLASEKIDQKFVQPIDALDNGIQFNESKIANLYPFDIGSITFSYYPTWKETDADILQIFLNLVSYAKSFLERVIVVVNAGIEAESLVLEAYNNSPDKRVIVLNERYPWEEVLMKLPEPIYAIYQNRDNNWSIKGVRNSFSSFEPRKKLPESWAGKRDVELETVTHVGGSVFCHNGRFMAVAKTKEGALQMAEIALKD